MADPPSTSEADAALRVTQRSGRRLLILLDRSRLSRDPTQIACVDQKLSQVNSFGRMLAERRRRLTEAQSQRDMREIAHLRRVVRRMVSQVRTLEREGRACVYPEALEDDRTVVIVTVDSTIRWQELSLAPVRP